MSAPDFLDTNILVYAYDVADPAKQHIAQDLVRRALAGEFLVSTQVLAEFAVTLLYKLSPPARPAEVSAILDALGPIKTLPPDADTVRRALEAHAQYGLHFYDGMILAAAERGACARI
jgi:predicted nucleic acid-binding protein